MVVDRHFKGYIAAKRDVNWVSKSVFCISVMPLDVVKKKFHKSVIFFANVLKHLFQ